MPFPYKLDTGDRFTGDFKLAPVPPPPPPTDAEQKLKARLDRLLADIADLKVTAASASYGRRDSERAKLAKSLQTAVEAVMADKLAVEDALLGTYEQWGRYTERCVAIDDCRFFVHGLDAAGREIGDDKRTGFDDILYKFGRGDPTAEQIKLKGDVDRALSVVREVMQPVNTKRERLRSDYVRALVGIAKSGLEYNKVVLASSELVSFKADFVLNEASALKNSYVRRLGGWGVVLGVLAAIVWTVIDFNFHKIHHPGILLALLHRFDNMLLISCGAACGAWLAFLIRRPTLAFDDLTNLDEDLLRPSARMIYTMLLAPVVGLMFWTGMVAITIGGFTSNVAQSGAVGLLVGVLCGIASRAVATAVGTRAADFAGVIGGAANPAK
jgi:hypothetical protein